ncbi:thermonuclease family protein [Sphingobium sp. AN641]|uniref:thermonuclease family protein n=1 Tax=Sphingobium sp. AN641 TaxID=3133443 RepID=UPI0030C2B73F
MATPFTYRSRRQRTSLTPVSIINLFLLAFLIGWYAPQWRSRIASPSSISGTTGSDSLSARFDLCHYGGGANCVVDGDTFWFGGTKYRIADIDTPETHGPRCAQEGALGARATDRLQQLLNAGPFTLEQGARDTDRYDRKLRVVTRDGVSIGGLLVAEGLARTWGGARQPWC